jgi:hypothetical protein
LAVVWTPCSQTVTVKVVKQLIRNGGFEEGEKYWTLYGYASVGENPPQPYEGTHLLTMYVPPAEQGIISGADQTLLSRATPPTQFSLAFRSAIVWVDNTPTYVEAKNTRLVFGFAQFGMKEEDMPRISTVFWLEDQTPVLYHLIYRPATKEYIVAGKTPWIYGHWHTLQVNFRKGQYDLIVDGAKLWTESQDVSFDKLAIIYVPFYDSGMVQVDAVKVFQT